MIILLDTNIILSAAFSRTSTSAKALKIAFQKHRVIASFESYSELKEVLYRKKFDALISPEDRRLVLKNYLKDTDLIHPEERIFACRDPKDNIILELAVAGKADFIITGDQDLLELDPFRTIRIMKPSEFLEIAEKE